MFRFSEPPCGERTGKYHITVNGKTLTPFEARVSAYPYNYGWPGYQRPLEQTELTDFVIVTADEPLHFTVEVPKKHEEVIIRPLSKRIHPLTGENGSITFTLTEPGQYSLEADGYHENLMIFVDLPEKDERNGGGRVLRYPAGIHRPGAVRLQSGDTVILDAGAVVYGSFYAVSAENIRIQGEGVLDGSYIERTSDTLLLAVDRKKPIPTDEEGFGRFAKDTGLLFGMIQLYACRNCEIRGVVCRDSAAFSVVFANCDGIRVHSLKTIGMWRYNTDGIDIFNSRNITVEDTFLRDFDDCMVVKGIKGWDAQNNCNITMNRLVVWCDWGRALEIGAETAADFYENILFEDCDIIHAAYSMLDIQNGDRAYVHDVTFRNIRCEYSKYQLPDILQTDMNVPYQPASPLTQSRLILIHGYTGQWSDDGIPGHTAHIRSENLSILTDSPGLPVPAIDIAGFDASHLTEDIRIDGIRMDGKRLTKQELTLVIGNYVRDLTVL